MIIFAVREFLTATGTSDSHQPDILQMWSQLTPLLTVCRTHFQHFLRDWSPTKPASQSTIQTISLIYILPSNSHVSDPSMFCLTCHNNSCKACLYICLRVSLVHCLILLTAVRREIISIAVFCVHGTLGWRVHIFITECVVSFICSICPNANNIYTDLSHWSRKLKRLIKGRCNVIFQLIGSYFIFILSYFTTWNWGLVSVSPHGFIM